MRVALIIEARLLRLSERHGSKESAAADVVLIDPSASLGMTEWDMVFHIKTNRFGRVRYIAPYVTAPHFGRNDKMGHGFPCKNNIAN